MALNLAQPQKTTAELKTLVASRTKFSRPARAELTRRVHDELSAQVRP